MFEESKNIKDLGNDKYKISYSIETDKDGYLDKECPSKECLYKFKVFSDDWDNKIVEDSVFCPKCRKVASKDSFYTTEQIENAKKQAVNQFKNEVSKMLSKMARDFNINHSNNSVKMEFKSNNKKNTILSIKAEKEFQQKIECSKCNFKYSIIGTAFFCPCCGYNSISKTFDKSIQKVESNLKFIKENFIEKTDETENFKMTLLETSFKDTIASFENYCKKIYTDYFDKNNKINFQDLKNANKAWKRVFNENYKNWLKEDEFEELNILFQKRHLLTHSDGIVGEIYLNRVTNSNYVLGQRIVIKEETILALINLIKIIVGEIREKLKELGYLTT